MAQLNNLIVTGSSRFLVDINGNLNGNAATTDNAAKLNGYASDTAATANTIVRRDANKYIYGTYFNANISNENINSYTNDPAIMFTSNDKWIRRTTKANLQTWLGLGSAAYKDASGSWGISVTGSSASCTGNAATATTAGNVTGTVAIANGGTGATTRLNALKALTNEDVGANATYFLTITNSWGKGGYSSIANVKTVLGLKSAAYTESSAYLASTTNYAGSSSVGGAATQATISNTNPTSSTTYFVPFVTSSGDQGLNANNGFKYYCLQGTTSAAGWGELVLGNSTSTGTAGNKSGWIKLFSEKSGQAELAYTAAATANTIHYLPAVGGTLLNTGNYMNYIIPGTSNVTVNSYAATGSEHTIISNVTTTNGYGIIISRDMSRMIIFKCYGGTLTQQNNSETLVLSKNSNNTLTLKNSQGQAAFGLIITT